MCRRLPFSPVFGCISEILVFSKYLLPLNTFLYSASLVLVNGTNTSISLEQIFPYSCSCSLFRKYFLISEIAWHIFPPPTLQLFQKCIQRQVGRVIFLTRPDRSRLVVVDSKSQAETMLTLKDLGGKPF